MSVVQLSVRFFYTTDVGLNIAPQITVQIDYDTAVKHAAEGKQAVDLLGLKAHFEKEIEKLAVPPEMMVGFREMTSDEVQTYLDEEDESQEAASLLDLILAAG